MDRRRFLKVGSHAAYAASLSAPLAALLPAATAFAAESAASPAQTARRALIRALASGAPNSLDPHGDGFNRESLGAFTNVYDRLVQFDRTALDTPTGVRAQAYRYDYQHLKGELATHYEALNDGKSWRFHLRRDARFHSGNPVTASAVKWSLDRAVTLPASKRQLATGSMTQAGQFVVEDPFTLRIDLPRADRYALPNLALTFASIIDAQTVQAHASADDPWGSAWLRANAAGGGAFRVEQWQSGQRIDYLRHEQWQSGTLPFAQRAISQAVPDSGNRLAALAKGDADMALQLSPTDFVAAAQLAQVNTLSVPVTNTFRFIAFNTQLKPFDDVRVRQAIAYALPYDDLFNGVAKGHGKPLFGGDPQQSPGPGWPEVYPYSTRIDHARALLKAAGFPNGFKTTLTFNTSDADICEPASLLIQQALKAISVDIAIEKAPGAQWGALQTAKTMPMFIDWSSAWFNDPDYFYRIFFEGDWRWNFSSFNSPELVKLTDAARWETHQPAYNALMTDAAKIVMNDVPMIPLWLPSFDIALHGDVRGFTYYIHGQVDFRTLRRS